MKYDAEFAVKMGSEQEDWSEASFNTLAQAVQWLNANAGRRICCAWINDQPVSFRNGGMVGKDGQPFCTNEEWHKTFASEDYPRILPNDDISDIVAMMELAGRNPVVIDPLKVPTREQLEKMLRPVITNPSTKQH